jgi:hypothetical protein
MNSNPSKKNKLVKQQINKRNKIRDGDVSVVINEE